MHDDTQAIAGCVTVLALLIVAPFVVAAIPALLGGTLGFLGFWLLMGLISAVVRAIFK